MNILRFTPIKIRSHSYNRKHDTQQQAVAQKLYDIKKFVNIKSSSFWLGNRMIKLSSHK